MGMFDKPVVRDTTANSSGEILRRLAWVIYGLSLLLVPVLGVAALAQRNSRLLVGALGVCAVFLGLHFTRRFWRHGASSRPRDVPETAASAAPRPQGDAAPGTIPAPSAHRRPRIAILNAALGGEAGNTAVLLALAHERLVAVADVSIVVLAREAVFENIRPTLAGADAFVIGTGTHWDSWSSVLQRFLEDATDAEGTALWLGKPVACVVTEHSVGGKGVLSRLQGVLVTLGCVLPPMSGLVLSRAVHVAAQHDPSAARDLWCEDDLAVVCHNLLEAVHGSRHWHTWPVDRTDFRSRWLKG